MSQLEFIPDEEEPFIEVHFVPRKERLALLGRIYYSEGFKEITYEALQHQALPVTMMEEILEEMSKCTITEDYGRPQTGEYE